LDLFYVTKEHPKEEIEENDQNSEVTNISQPGHILKDVKSDDGATKTCSNCLKEVPISSLERHEAFCKRNNIRCEACNAVVSKTQLDQHLIEMHQKVECICKEMIEKYLISTHKTTSCTHRIMKCKYCKLTFKKKDLHEHIIYCGSRTEVCNKCKQPVMLRDVQKHISSKCAHPPPQQTRPQSEPGFVSSFLKFFTL